VLVDYLFRLGVVLALDLLHEAARVAEARNDVIDLVFYRSVPIN
jgi:hypothetical protein